MSLSINHNRPVPGRQIRERGWIYALFERHGVMLAALVGGLLILPLPLFALVLKFDACHYGPGTDIGGVWLVLPPFVVAGAITGAVAGLIGRGLGGLFRQAAALKHAAVIGTVIVVLIASVASTLVSQVPFFVFMFPDC